MFGSYDLTRALVIDRQTTLQQDARHHMSRAARRRRKAQSETPSSSVPAARSDALPTPKAQPLPPATALAEWRRDQRAA